MKNNEELNRQCGERLKNAIRSSCYKEQKEFAKTVHFTQQYISDMCRGKKPIGYENAYNFSRLLNIRQEYLLCIDDYITDADLITEKASAIFSKVGEFAIDPDTPRKIDRIERISQLGDAFRTLKVVYGVPDGWDERSIADGMKLLLYLDEQLANAFRIYFKYFDCNTQSTALSDSSTPKE